MEMQRKFLYRLFCSCIGLFLFFTSCVSYAAVVIGPDTVISAPTTYTGVTLDMTNGSFIIKNNATLTITNDGRY